MKNGKGYKSEIIIDLSKNSQKDVIVERLKSSTPYVIKSVKGADGVFSIVVEASPKVGKASRRVNQKAYIRTASLTKEPSYVEKIAESCGLLLEKKPEKKPQKAFPQLAIAQEK